MGAGDNNFTAAADQTSNRAIGSTYTNGPRRRMVIAFVICTAAAAGQAYAGFTTTSAGVALTAASAVGLPSGSTDATRLQVVFFVDPNQTYSVTSSVGTGASVALQQWLEVDL